ncbi:unnamed protein product [Arabis nemorensis]|uniref:Uncharacterized protein n=1 Tax=Arabis nemorensis TaxID=586526 RepID=A0A565C9X3_9BRAS|nr:unnamed protein product [Arabis nemorensis]
MDLTNHHLMCLRLANPMLIIGRFGHLQECCVRGDTPGFGPNSFFRLVLNYVPHLDPNVHIRNWQSPILDSEQILYLTVRSFVTGRITVENMFHYASIAAGLIFAGGNSEASNRLVFVIDRSQNKGKRAFSCQ